MITKELDNKFAAFLKVITDDKQNQDNAVIYVADELARLSDIRALWGEYLEITQLSNEAYKMFYKDETELNLILCAALRTLETYVSDYVDDRKKHFKYVKNKDILAKIKKSKKIIIKGSKD